MKISLIVTTYERPDALAAVFRSIERQSLRPDEVVVADDGSGPETAEVVRGAAKRMNVLHEWREHDGFRAARMRNRALARASGEYIVIIDGDILAHRDFLADHAHAARPNCFFVGKRVFLGPETTRLALESEAYWPSIWSAGIMRRRHLVRSRFVTRLLGTTGRHARSYNMAFWREDAVAVNGFNEDFVGWGGEDEEFAARLTNNGVKDRSLACSALACHLYHPSRPNANLRANIELLTGARETGAVWCGNGLTRDGGARRDAEVGLKEA